MGKSDYIPSSTLGHSGWLHIPGKPGEAGEFDWSGKLGKVRKIVVYLLCATAVAIVIK